MIPVRWKISQIQPPPVDELVIAYYPRWSEGEGEEASFEEEHISPAKLENRGWYSPEGDYMGKPVLWISFRDLLSTVNLNETIPEHWREG